MTIDREAVKEQFDRFVEQYDLSDVKVKLKWEHTYYVADNSERIALSLSMPKEDVNLAWVLGMFHDIGRFEQLRRYNTFQDNVSVNHAQLSADMLFQDNLVLRFLPDLAESKQSETLRHLMDCAVRYHNCLCLPETLTSREKRFADLLRDADKADILRVNCQTPRTEIYDLPEEAFLYSEMTDEVYDAIVHCREVDRQYSKTGIDFIMGHVGFVFGLVYPESKRIVAEQGYLDQLLAFDSQNPVTQNRLIQVRQAVNQYLHG